MKDHIVPFAEAMKSPFGSGIVVVVQTWSETGSLCHDNETAYWEVPASGASNPDDLHSLQVRALCRLKSLPVGSFSFVGTLIRLFVSNVG